MRRARDRWSLAPAVVVALLLAACGEQTDTSAPAAAAPPPSVTVQAVQPTDVTPSAQFNGRVVAVDTVDLRARVTGFLEQRLFEEGADVASGELLFLLEKDQYQAVVDQRQAQVASAQANKADTAAQLLRGEELVKNGNIPQSEVDLRRAEDEMAGASIQEAEAALEQAKINLGYTEIHAPLAGRIGRSAFSIGNLVGPDSGVLATIVSRDPIYVTFPVSTRQVLQFRKRALESGQAAEVVVRADLPDGSTYGHPGKVDFINIEADQTTDTITVRAEFPNPDGFLVAGEFVNVTVEGEEPEQRLVVPQSALQIDQAGAYVLIVNSQDQVEQRRVETGQSYAGNVAIESGLQAGDQVIVEGLQKVRPGEKVQVSVAPAPSATPLSSGTAGSSGTSQPEAASSDADQTPPSASEGSTAASSDESAPAAPGAGAPAPATADSEGATEATTSTSQ